MTRKVMGRPPKPSAEKRGGKGKVTYLKLTKDEKRDLSARAKAAGKSESAYVREKALA
jgi:hypothetical protein